MIRLNELEAVMKPQFVFMKNPPKPLVLNEEVEGVKDLARTIFVGLSDMYGIPSDKTMAYLDMGYDSFRNKLSEFRKQFRDGRDAYGNDDGNPAVKLFIKTSLCLNAIKFKYQTNPYVRLETWINFD